MSTLSSGLAVFSEPLLLVALSVLTYALLETERRWTRSRRKRGLEPGAIAYLIDGLVLAGMVLVLVGAATLFVGGLASIAGLLGGVFDGQRVGVLIVGMALALGLVITLARIARGRRAAQGLVGPSAMVPAPADLGANIAGPSLDGAPEYQAAYAPAPGERYDAQSLPSVSLLQERRQPAPATATSVPTSFLNLEEPGAPTPTRSHAAPALLTLGLVVVLVSGAVLFRDQVFGLLVRVEPSSRAATAASGDSSLPDVGAAAANVSAAAPTALGPTAAPAAVAPPPPSGAQGATKHVKSEGLNMRAQPGTDQQVMVVLKKGAILTVFTDAQLIHDTIWVKVRFGDQEGWVDQSLLE